MRKVEMKLIHIQTVIFYSSPKRVKYMFKHISSNNISFNVILSKNLLSNNFLVHMNFVLLIYVLLIYVK